MQIEFRQQPLVQSPDRARAELDRVRRFSGGARLSHLQDAIDAAVAAATYPRGATGRDGEWSSHDALTPAVWRLHVRFYLRRDTATLRALVARYDDEARRLARRRGTRFVKDDLVQVAREALVLALRRFDPGRGKPFLAYARVTIDGSLRRHLRDHGYTIRPSRRNYELSFRVAKAREGLVADLHRAPTVEEIVDVVDAPRDDVVDVLTNAQRRVPVSFDQVSADGIPLSERIATGEPGVDRLVDRMALRDAMLRLSEFERELVKAYFFEEQTQQAIANRYGVSQMTVSRLLSRTLRRLRAFL